MKRVFTFTILLIGIFSVFQSASAQITYNVTVPAGTNACYISGWDINAEGTTEMTKIDATHYTITITDPNVTTSSVYNYCSGPNRLLFKESTLANPTVGRGDRTWSASDVVEAWKAVYDPNVTPPKLTYNVTVPAGTVTCYLAGDINSWSPTATPMTKVDDTHFTVTIDFATTEHKYVYLSGPSWDYEERAADGISAVPDRTYSPNDVVATWKALFLNGLKYTVKVPAGTNACYLTGQMNDWSATANPMTKVDATHYTITLTNALTSQEYLYLCGPDWQYEECGADGITSIPNRTYSEADEVIAWKAIYVPAGFTYNVTVPPGTAECKIEGAMNGWVSSPMTKIDATHYSITYPSALATDDYVYRTVGDVKESVAADGLVKRDDRTDWTANDVVLGWYNMMIKYNVTVPPGTTACSIETQMNEWATVPMKMVDATHYTLDMVNDTLSPGYYHIYRTVGDVKETVAADGLVRRQDRTKWTANDVVLGWYNMMLMYNVTVPVGTTACSIETQMNDWAIVPMTMVDATHYRLSMVNDTLSPGYYHIYRTVGNVKETTDAAGLNRREDRTHWTPMDIVIGWYGLMTSVKELTMDNHKIYTEYGSIVVEGVRSRIELFDMSGRAVQTQKLKGKFVSESLKSGLYIIRVDGVTKKVAVVN